jgi:hypothetical protein
MNLEEAIKSWSSRAGVVRVRSALNPILWTMAVALPLFLLAAYFFRDDPLAKWVLLTLAASSFLLTIVSYFIFLFKDPDRLQSEEFVLKQQELVIASRNREGLPQPIEAEGRELPNVVEVDPSEGEPQ